MPHDSIKTLHIEGLRTLLDVRLHLNALTVLTGENGSGKSTIIEACEILRLAAEPKFLEAFISYHGGFDAFRSYGSRHVRLAVRIAGQGCPLEYSLTIENVAGLAITEETLEAFPEDGPSFSVLKRFGRQGTVLQEKTGQHEPIRAIPGSVLLLTGLGFQLPHAAIRRVVQALKQIDVHLPFAVLPSWVERRLGTATPSMRTSRLNAPSDTLERLGLNLANVYKALREDPSWLTTLDYVQLGLGPDIDDIKVRETPDGGRLELWFRYKSFESEVPASSLSDGTLGYLAFVALFRLAPKRSLIAFDEPEGTLHPTMAARVAQLLEALSEESTILVATHSDRFLDALTAPQDSVVLCALGPRRETILLRPDKALLQKWLQENDGLGHIRRLGYEASIMTRTEDK
jgi:predicted ATPase